MVLACSVSDDKITSCLSELNKLTTQTITKTEIRTKTKTDTRTKTRTKNENY